MDGCVYAQVELFFDQELGNISSYAPSGVPTEHTTSSLSVKRSLRYALFRYSIFGVGRYASLSAINYYAWNDN
ncbi:transmembrane protein, putative [Medicago truncatula]|uniref:Transmembrane protein, putative n=1 Tax=Medicago truncatula TaxID=3880 RepID=G7KBB0_MEDTR|nr:transmembrane protein, putative [Medicago truncatula]